MSSRAYGSITITDLVDGGIASTEEWYKLSNSTSETFPSGGSGWTQKTQNNTIPIPTSVLKYLWFYEITTYTDGNVSTWGPLIVGTYGEQGNTGVGYVAEQKLYYLTNSDQNGPLKPTQISYPNGVTSTSTNANTWTLSCPPWQSGYYYWCCHQFEKTDGTFSWTDVWLDRALSTANETAAAAQTTANSKAGVYYGTTDPTSGTYNTGDIWVRKNSSGTGGDVMWYYNGTTWVQHSIGTTTIIDGSIITDKIATGAVRANQIDTGAITADKIDTGAITIQKLNSDVTNAINSANGREQLIYISKASGTLASDVQANETWVTTATDVQNAWTIKRPTYNSSYPVLFVATQRQTLAQMANSGTGCSCTTPIIDDTTTVIDGGHITTGTIDASVINVSNINASNITSGTIDTNRLAAGAITADKINVGALTVGGKNLLHGTDRMISKGSTSDWKEGTWRASLQTSGIGGVVFNRDLPTQVSGFPSDLGLTKGVALVSGMSSGTPVYVGIAQDKVPLPTGSITLSAWVQATAGSVLRLMPYWYSSIATDFPDNDYYEDFVVEDSDWHFYSATAVVPESEINTLKSAGYVYCTGTAQGQNCYVAGLMLVSGVKPAQWMSERITAGDIDLYGLMNIYTDSDLAYSAGQIGYASNFNQSNYAPVDGLVISSDGENSWIAVDAGAPPNGSGGFSTSDAHYLTNCTIQSSGISYDYISGLPTGSIANTDTAVLRVMPSGAWFDSTPVYLIGDGLTLMDIMGNRQYRVDNINFGTSAAPSTHPAVQLWEPSWVVGTTPSSNDAGGGLRFYDGSSELVGIVHPTYWSDGRLGIRIGAYRTVSGTSINNSLNLSIDDNGNRNVSVNEAAPWRKALGLSYSAGDTLSGTFGVSGYITNSGQSVWVEIQLPKLIESGVTVTCSGATNANLRHIGGGYISGANATLTSYISGASLSKRANSLGLCFLNTSGWGVTNNTPIAGTIDLTLNFS